MKVKFLNCSIKKKYDGFSLLELLVVIAIIGIVLSFIVPNVINRPSEARKLKITNDINVLESALELFKLDNGKYPSEEDGLEILVNQQKQYIKGLPNDPWGVPYRYKNPGKFNNIDIWTYGADKTEGGEDENSDIGNWLPKK
tara:strand:- start:82 stop:507 length:426 start_codon:yes stop_codon:yes gene_type:complete